MRQRLALALCAALPGVAAAAPSKPAAAPAPAGSKPKPIDVTAMRDKLAVYRDDAGHVLVAPRELAEGMEAWVFWGDGKALYQQRVFGSGGGDTGLEFDLWSPRVSEQAGAVLTLPAGASKDGPELSCGSKAVHALTQVPADQAKAMLARATFYSPLWQRQTHFIARDDDGTYYFVDALRDEYGGGSYRLFVGKRAGQMKEQALTNVVSDPAGEVFATKDGSLKTFGPADKPPVWRHGDKTTELTPLDVTDGGTRLIIYRDFGIYGALGTPCD